MQTIYRPGQWYLIVLPGALVALPPDVPAEVLTRLWQRLPAQKTLGTVVDVLTAHAGGSFAALPPFVAAVAEGTDVRIALRGGVAARVSTRDGAQELSGAEVTTWSERFVAGASRVEITVEAVEGAAALPVQSGIVRGAAVSAELDADDDGPVIAALGPAPVVDVAQGGASAAALDGSPAPALAAFGAATAAGAGATSASEPEQENAPYQTDERDQTDEPEGTPAVEEATATEESPATESVVETDEPVVSSEPVVALEAAPDADQGDSEQSASVDGTPTEALPVVEDGSAPSSASEPEPEPEPEPAPEPDGVTLVPTDVTLAPGADDDFDQLWGATVHSPPAVAAPPAPPAPPVPPAPPAPASVVTTQGDHDGATISAAELRALRQNPPSADETPTAVLPVAAGSTGRVRVSTGQVVTLDRTVIIGRRPRSTRASGASLPHLVAVESPQQDISRSHLEIRPEGDTVVVIDLHTTNGSTLLRPGADPMRLHPGEQTLVLSGDVVDLGDGVTVAFEDLP